MRPTRAPPPCTPRAVLDKTRVFMLEWARKAEGAPAEGALIEHVNDWFACMTADAVVKARGASAPPMLCPLWGARLGRGGRRFRACPLPPASAAADHPPPTPAGVHGL